MKETIFKLQNGDVIETFQMRIQTPYTPINISEQVVLGGFKFIVKDVVHYPLRNKREIILKPIA